MARNMISKRFDVTTGNPRKLFGFVRDSIMNAGYDTSPEKGGALVEPIISSTAIRDKLHLMRISKE